MMKELFTTYGAFVTMALGLVGYFINRYYGYKTKKAELDYSFFQEHKIKAIVKFFDCYSKAERMWQQFPVYSLLHGEFDGERVDKHVWPTMNSLNISICELTLYLNQEELIKFNNIYERLLQQNQLITDIFLIDTPKESFIKKANMFAIEQEIILKDCRIILKQIGENTRNSFVK